MTKKKPSEKIPWRYFVDHHESIVWCKVENWMSACMACPKLKKIYPGYECHYASEAFLDKKEKGEL